MGGIPGERAFMGGIFCARAVRCVILGIKAVWMIYLVQGCDSCMLCIRAVMGRIFCVRAVIGGVLGVRAVIP